MNLIRHNTIPEFIIAYADNVNTCIHLIKHVNKEWVMARKLTLWSDLEPRLPVMCPPSL